MLDCVLFSLVQCNFHQSVLSYLLSQSKQGDKVRGLLGRRKFCPLVCSVFLQSVLTMQVQAKYASMSRLLLACCCMKIGPDMSIDKLKSTIPVWFSLSVLLYCIYTQYTQQSAHRNTQSSDVLLDTRQIMVVVFRISFDHFCAWGPFNNNFK